MPKCESCGALLDPTNWRRDTPQPAIALLAALSITGITLATIGGMGAGPEGLGAIFTHVILGTLAAMMVAIAALAWFFFAHLAYVSWRGKVAYVGGQSGNGHERRAWARVGHDGTLTAATGKSLTTGKTRFVPPLSFASTETGRQVVLALRKLAAHEKLTIRALRHVSWRRTDETAPVTSDYRTFSEEALQAEHTEEPHVFAESTDAEATAGAAAWYRAIGLEVGGSSPLGAYVAWMEDHPEARARLVEAAAVIDAEEEAHAEAGREARQTRW